MPLIKKVLSSVFLGVLFGAIAPFFLAHASTFSNGYTYSRTITVSKSLLAPSGTALSNFPMLVSGTYNYLAASSSASGTLQSPKGYDIIFTSDASGTNKLAYERENYTSSTGAINFWVKVPTLSSSSRLIYMFYDATTTVDQSSPTGTWNSNYLSVYHLPDGTTLTTKDSTVNGYNATNTAATAIAGEIGGGAKLAGGTSAYLSVAQGGHFRLSTSTFTVEMWVNDNTTAGNLATFHRLLSWYDGSKNIQLGLGQDSGQSKRVFYLQNCSSNCNPQVISSSTQSTGMHDVAVTFDGSSTYAMYVDGMKTSGGNVFGNASNIFSTNSTTLYVGQRGDGGNTYASGTIDEVRISNTNRSPDWIITQYNNQSNPAGFYTIGSSTTPSSGPAPALNVSSTYGCSTLHSCSFQIVASNSPTSYSASSLPAGLTLNTSTGLISGTTTAATGTSYYATVGATNAAGTATTTVQFGIWSTATYPWDGVDTPDIYSSVISSWEYDSAGPGYSYSGIPTSPSAGTVIFTGPSQWVDYTMSNSTSSYYDFWANVGATSTGNLLDIKMDGTDLTGNVIVPNSGSISNETSTAEVLVYIPKGVHTFQALNASGSFSLFDFQFDHTSSGPAPSSSPVITSTTTLPCLAGYSCTYTITATNAPTSFSATGLVPGLSVSSSTGVISGTTTSTTGLYSATISATNAAGTGTSTLLIGNWYSNNYPYDGVHPVTFPGTIQAQQIDNGPSPTAYNGITTSTNYIAYTSHDQWADYATAPTSSGDYIATVSIASPTSGVVFFVGVPSWDNQEPDINVPNTGSLTNYANVTTTVRVEGGTTANFGTGFVELRAGTYDVNAHVQGVTFTPLPPLTIPGEINVLAFDPGGFNNGYYHVFIYPNDVEFSEPNGWVNYTVNVSSSGEYLADVRTATGVGGQSLQILVDGTSTIPVLNLPNSGSYTTFVDSTTTIPLTAGTHVIQIFSATDGFNLNKLSFAPLPNTVPGSLDVQAVDPGGPGVGYSNGTLYSGVIGFGAGAAWADYTVNVSSTATYLITAGTATGAGGINFNVIVDGSSTSPTVNVPNTGDWVTYSTATTTMTLTAGMHDIRINTGSGAFNMNNLTFATTGGGGGGGGGASSTYYVNATTGSDSNNGTSSSTPWQTLAKVNATSFNPGDTILFARGQQWHESLVASSNGNPGNPITYDAYGTGANPIFWGSNVLASSSWTSAGGNLYTYNYGSPIGSFFENHAFLLSSGSATPTSTGRWGQISTTTIEVDLATNPATDGNVYTAGVRQDVVSSNYMNHLVFNNLNVKESAAYQAGYGFRIENSNDVLVENSSSTAAGIHNFGFINSTGVRGVNLYGSGLMPAQGLGGASTFVSFGDASGLTSNQTSTWTNITAGDVRDYSVPGAYYDAFVTHGENNVGGSVTLNGLTATNGLVFLNNTDNPSTTIAMNGGNLTNEQIQMYGAGIVVNGVTMTGASSSVDMESNNSTLENSLITGTNLGYTWYQTAVLSHGNNNTVRFNTIVMSASSTGGMHTPLALQVDNTGFSYYGNMLVSDGNALHQWAGTLSSSSITDADYNFYSGALAFSDGSNSYTLSQWQAKGFDTHSLSGSPSFTNAAGGDYSLQNTSPAVNSASITPTSTILASLPTDILGNPRLYGIAFDMGAYENQSASSIPSINSAGTLGCTTLSSCSYTITANNTPTSFSASGLPAGLSLATSTGVISGTATAATGTYSVTLGATNGIGTGTSTLLVGIWNTAEYPYDGVHPAPIPGTIQPQRVDGGGSGVAYASGTQIGSNFINFTAPFQWVNYTVNVSTTANYNMTVSAATGASSQSIQVFVDGSSTTPTISIPDTGDWATFANTTATVPLSAGRHIFQIYTGSGALAINSINLVQGGYPAIPGSINVQNIDPGGQGVGYNDITIDPGVIVFNHPGDWVNYTVNVSSTANYTMTAGVATGASGGESLQIFVDGTSTTPTIPVPDTGSWTTYTNVTSTVPLSAGQHTIQVYTGNGAFNLDSLSFAQVPLPVIPGSINVQGVDPGGSGVGYSGVTIYPGVIGFNAAGNWVNYTVNVSSTANYVVTASTATGVNGEGFQVLVDGTSTSPTMTAPNTGGWTTYANVSTTIPLTAGTHVLQVYTGNGGFNLNGLVFTQVPLPTLPGSINVQAVDMGGPGVGYSGVTIYPGVIAWPAGSGWVNYTVNVSSTASYTMTIGTATGVTGENFQLLVDGTSTTSAITLPNTGGWTTYANTTSSVSLPAGTHTLQVYSANGGFNMNGLQFN